MTAVGHGLDPRVERTRATVLEATVELLATEGFERITIDAIAERSGVARSTIYRNWTDRGELLVEAFTRVCDLPPIPDHGSLAADLAFLGRHLAAGLTSDEWGQMVPSLVGAAGHDPEIRQALATFSARRRAEALELVERAKARGEIDAALDAERSVERFAGAFFFRRLIVQAPIDETFVDDQVEALCRDLGCSTR